MKDCELEIQNLMSLICKRYDQKLYSTDPVGLGWATCRPCSITKTSPISYQPVVTTNRTSKTKRAKDPRNLTKGVDLCGE